MNKLAACEFLNLVVKKRHHGKSNWPASFAYRLRHSWRCADIRNKWGENERLDQENTRPPENSSASDQRAKDSRHDNRMEPHQPRIEGNLEQLRYKLWHHRLPALLARVVHTVIVTGKPSKLTMLIDQENDEADDVVLVTGQSWRDEIVEGIANSTHHIEIAMYMMTPQKKKNDEMFSAMNREILAAPSRGVACRAVLPTWGEKDSLKNINREWAAIATEAGWRLRYMHKNKLQHSKFWIFDKAVTIIGSHNVTSTALTQNIELSVVIRRKKTAIEASRFFEKLWIEAS